MRRLQNLGLAALALAVLGLIASTVMGVAGKPSAGVLASMPAGAVPEPPADRVTVEVLNASGRPGLAREVTSYLRARGFDVVSNGNARPADGTATRVLARTRDTARARSVADSLAIKTVAAQVDPTLQLDASVVLGKDWSTPGAPSTVSTSSAPTAPASAGPSAAAAPASASASTPAPPATRPAAKPASAPPAHRPAATGAHPHAKPAAPAVDGARHRP